MKKKIFCIARKALYCDIVALDVQERRIVLQVEWVLKIVLKYNFCNEIQFLYCREEGLRAGSCITIQQIVLQGCVVGWEEKNCIAIHKLYCD